MFVRTHQRDKGKIYLDEVAFTVTLVVSHTILGHKKSFVQMIKEDMVDGYLRSLKKGFEEDPDQSWINTHNLRGSCYLAFWKWLTQNDLPREQSNKVDCSVYYHMSRTL
jgi:hypothetical protein